MRLGPAPKRGVGSASGRLVPGIPPAAKIRLASSGGALATRGVESCGVLVCGSRPGLRWCGLLIMFPYSVRSRPTGGRGHSSEYQGVIVVFWSITSVTRINASASACGPSALSRST